MKRRMTLSKSIGFIMLGFLGLFIIYIFGYWFIISIIEKDIVGIIIPLSFFLIFAYNVYKRYKWTYS